MLHKRIPVLVRAPILSGPGCGRCVLPFKYAPMDTCALSQDSAAACAAKGGDVVSGWCVVCKILTFTSCTYLDQVRTRRPARSEWRCGAGDPIYERSARSESRCGRVRRWRPCPVRPLGQ